MFEGDISEIALYPTVLSAVEVSTLYNAQRDALTEQLTSDRIEDLLETAGVTTHDLEVGQSTMAATDPTGSVLDEIFKAVDTESGQFFITGDGTARFHDRHYRLLSQTVPIDTFDGGSGSDLTYYEIEPSYDDSQLWTQVQVTPSSGDPFTATADATVLSAYGTRTLPLTTYPADANEAADQANHLLGVYSEPSTRIDRIVFRLGKHADLWPIILGAEIGNRYTIGKTLAGDDLAQDVYLEAISHRISATKEWEVEWQLSPAVSQEFWLLGEAGFSELGETTTLGF
ncbi:MAG TPA: hypothetical protein VIY86_13090, partial [Pirellulaceae bacterium]